MKKDSDPPKPKLKLSLPKKTGEDGSPTPPPSTRKPPPPLAKNSKKPTALRKNPKTGAEIVPSVELEPADEVFWEVFEMDNLGFPEKKREPDDTDVSHATPPSEPPLEPGEATPDTGESGPRTPKLGLRDTPPTNPRKTLENASVDDFFLDEDKAKPEDTPPVGANMLIGDSEDQIAHGPGRLTPEDERPKRPPPPLDAPVLPQDQLDERAPRLTEEDPNEPDEFDFLASDINADAHQPEEKSRKDEADAETSPLRGRRFWVTLGLVAAIAGASAFTLSITRESRPVDEQPLVRTTPAQNSAVSAPVRVTTPSSLSMLVESPDAIRTPETTAALQSLVDGFLISVTHPGGNRPRVVINEVTVPVGAILDPYTGLRLVQIQEEPRALIFEDGGGQTYTRPF